MTNELQQHVDIHNPESIAAWRKLAVAGEIKLNSESFWTPEQAAQILDLLFKHIEEEHHE